MVKTAEEKAAAKVAKDAEKAAAKVDVSTAFVTSQAGGHIRTYTREIHGDDFEDLAKQMSDQHPGSTIQLA